VAGGCWRKLGVPGLPDLFVGLLQQHSQPGRRYPTRPGEDVRFSETRILGACLRNAYSQNYLYLIKKPEDQYQVILEVEDVRPRSKPEDLSLLYIKSDDGKNLVTACGGAGHLEQPPSDRRRSTT